MIFGAVRCKKTPILPIGSKTPPEIAIAVLAEITAERKAKHLEAAESAATEKSAALA